MIKLNDRIYCIICLTKKKNNKDCDWLKTFFNLCQKMFKLFFVCVCFFLPETKFFYFICLVCKDLLLDVDANNKGMYTKFTLYQKISLKIEDFNKSLVYFFYCKNHIFFSLNQKMIR